MHTRSRKPKKNDPEYNAFNLRRYRKNNPEKQKAIRRKNDKLYKERHKDKVRAGIILRRATAKGTIIRQPCRVCGNVNSHGHHKDYSKPLNVDWLCDKHHKEEHRNNIEKH